MIRKTLTIVSLIGLVLSAGLWGMSYWRVYRYGENMVLTVFLHHGYIGYKHFTGGNMQSSAVVKMHGFQSPPSLRWLPYHRVTRNSGQTLSTVAFPLWISLVLFGFGFAILYLPFRRRRKRKKLGLCVKCGYNLKGLTEPRCPECGEAFEKPCSARP